MTNRRSFFKASTAATFAVCPLCRAALAAEGAHWDYEHVGEWGKLVPEFRECSLGTQQSPIDLDHPIPSALGDLAVDWRPGPLDIVNNGHTIQANVEPGSRLRIGDSAYEMTQFHFHHPSEHTVAGTRFAMEAHFVHGGKGGNAVLGVFLVPGRDNAALAKLWDHMPKKEGKARINDAIDPKPLLPAVRAYYRYQGSLTTPPCSETVVWTVFAEPVEVSEAQIDAFAAIFPMNARPLQKLNRRFLLGSF